MDADWVCNRCHSINGARRPTCYSCRADRKSQPTEQGSLPGWPPMANSSGETPAVDVRPTVRYTGVILRAVALGVDLAVISCYWGALLLTPLGRALNGPILAGLLLGGPALYFLIGWGSYGTTLGMRLLRLRIVRGNDGSRIGYGTALVRLIGFAVSIVAFVTVVGSLLALPMVLDKRRRGVHDHIAGTVVVRPAGGL